MLACAENQEEENRFAKALDARLINLKDWIECSLQLN
jgi:hypothetical protein